MLVTYDEQSKCIKVRNRIKVKRFHVVAVYKFIKVVLTLFIFNTYV